MLGLNRHCPPIMLERFSSSTIALGHLAKAKPCVSKTWVGLDDLAELEEGQFAIIHLKCGEAGQHLDLIKPNPIRTPLESLSVEMR